MPRYRYRALRHTGGKVQGELVAVDEREAASRLQASGNFPIEIAPAVRRRAASVRTGGRRLPARELILFTRQFSALVSAGIAVDRALALIAGDRGHSRRAELADGLLAAIHRGESLSSACMDHPAVAQHYAMVIAAGEARGDIGGALGRLATVLERNRAITQSLANALIYPASVLVVACLSISFLLAFVVPRFETLLTGFRQEPPLAMRLLLALSSGFHDYGLPLMAVAIAAAALFFIRRRDAAFRLVVDRRMLSLPVIGTLLTRVETERIAFLLGNLLAAGVELPNALAAAGQAMPNAALRAVLATARSGVERGDGVTAALAASGLLPAMVLELVRVGDETGDIAAMLLKASEILKGEVEATASQMIGLVAPLSMVALGLLIGAVALAIFGSILEVYDIAT
jgi:type II secretory pathway component PulF